MRKYVNEYLTEPAINILPGHEQIMNDLQVNILRSHKRKYSRYLFLRFHEEAQGFVRKFLKKMADGFVNNEVKIQITSAAEQFGVGDFKEDGELNSKEVYGVYLTYQGYNFLELSNLAPDDLTFQRSIENLDNATKGFHRGEPDDSFSNLHAMILIGSNNKQDIPKCVASLKSEMGIKNGKTEELQRISIIGDQSGESLYNKDTKVNREHFGYLDGISQPRFFPSTSSRKSSLRLSSFSSLDTVLVQDKGGQDKSFSYGSFLAFLKLEQDSTAFQTLIGEIKALGLKDKNGKSLVESDDDAKAIIMGRYPNGATILKKRDKDQISSHNNFDYNELVSDGKNWINDEQGIGCPFFSHVRKANPRSENTEYQKSKRITRRGVPYQDSETKKGLLFMSFQRNIQEQFENLLAQMHSSQLNGVHAGMDLLTGHHDNARIINGNPHAVIKPSEPLIIYRGGAYFFAPSISFFKNITKFYPHLKKEEGIVEPEEGMQRAIVKIENMPIKIFDDFRNIKLKPIILGDHRDEMIKSILDDSNGNGGKGINEVKTTQMGPVA